jgi:hypothetical protein
MLRKTILIGAAAAALALSLSVSERYKKMEEDMKPFHVAVKLHTALSWQFREPFRNLAIDARAASNVPIKPSA